MLTYADDVCRRMLTYAIYVGCEVVAKAKGIETLVHLTYADVCRRMLTYAIYVGCEVVAKAKGIETLVHLLETSASDTALLRYASLY
jgi:hypothetical protein